MATPSHIIPGFQLRGQSSSGAGIGPHPSTHNYLQGKRFTDDTEVRVGEKDIAHQKDYK